MAVRLADNAIVGIVNIRHYLTDAIYHNGHIGYSVHPLERNKGYGSEILRLALIKAEQLGILETVVTCNSDNRVSKHLIEKHGLSFQKQFTEDNGNIVLIYTTQTD
jgi:predicted acetyltransferase